MKKNQPFPPGLAKTFLLRFLRADLAEEVLGDLEEQFQVTLTKKSLFKARLNYWYQVINYLRPFAISKSKSTNSDHYAMFQNYFKIGYRNLFKNKGHAFINIGGLSIGMLVTILISLWVHDELTYNKYHQNYDSIVKVLRFDGHRGQEYVSQSHVRGLGPLLRTEYSSHFKDVIMVRARIEEHVIANRQFKFTQKGYFMEAGGPEMFSLKMVHGTREGLTDMNSILLSESLANKLFGNINPINQIVKMDAAWDLKVTGVYEDLPLNSEFHAASYFAPLERYIEGRFKDDVWTNQFLYIFAQLNPGVELQEVTSLIKNVLEPHTLEGRSVPQLSLLPMSKWHLHSSFRDGVHVTSERLRMVWFFGTIGVFVLLLACINFVNLNTARSEKRSREVGIRKSIGSARVQLVMQFLSESFMVVTLAFITTLFLLTLALPWFNEVAGKAIVIPWTNLWFWGCSLGFIIITSFLSGSYPALYLSSFKPIKVLKGTITIGRAAARPRKILVVFQFTISIVLIIGTIIINEQIQHVKDRPVGYSKKGLLMFKPAAPEYWGKYQILRNEFRKTGVVTEMAEANYPITNTRGNNGGFTWQGKEPSFNPTFNTISVTHEYGKTVGWEFLQGRDFSRDFQSDLSGVVITESALKLMELENPVGEVITWDPSWRKAQKFTILGIIKDMVKGSPYEKVRPSIIFLSERDLSWLFIRINPEVSAGEALPKIEATFNRIIPSAPFDYHFVDELYDAKFRAEERISTLAGFMAAVAIFISCLGLLGLVSFDAERRTREIGVRKVLGASTTRIWAILTGNYVMLVLFSSIIAIPNAYYILYQWLQNFDYRLEISWWVFAVAGGGSLLVTLMTISFQAIKSAKANPVDALRTE